MKPPKIDPRRRFCQALQSASAGRPLGWWASINSVADRLGMGHDRAALLAHECEQVGLVKTDVPDRIRGQRLPHSVTLTEEGRVLARPLDRLRQP